MNRVLISICILAVSILACGTPAEEWELKGWTVTPPAVVYTSTPKPPTQTPFVVVVTNTPEPTKPAVEMCVVAQEAVYLRATPNSGYYPIDPLRFGTKVVLSGARDGDWVFVTVGTRSGWVNSKFIGKC